MIKKLAFFRRRKDLDVEAFQEYWRKVHAKVALEIPGIVRYVQNHVLVVGPEQGDASSLYGVSFDGVAEVWFESMDAVRANAGRAELSRVAEDEKNFIDGDSMESIFADELVVDGSAPPENAIKLWRFSKRAADLEPDEFFEAYREVPISTPASRTEQNHCRRGFYSTGREPVFDAVRMEWYDDAAKAMKALGDRVHSASEIMKASRPLEDPKRSGSLLAREIVIRG